MIIDILVKYGYQNVDVGFLNRVVKYKDKSFHIFNKSTMVDVKVEIDYLVRIGALKRDGNIVALTDLGKEMAKSAIYEGMAASCLSNHASLVVSHKSYFVSKCALIVSIIAILIALYGLATQLQL